MEILIPIVAVIIGGVVIPIAVNLLFDKLGR